MTPAVCAGGRRSTPITSLHWPCRFELMRFGDVGRTFTQVAVALLGVTGTNLSRAPSKPLHRGQLEADYRAACRVEPPPAPFPGPDPASAWCCARIRTWGLLREATRVSLDKRYRNVYVPHARYLRRSESGAVATGCRLRGCRVDAAEQGFTNRFTGKEERDRVRRLQASSAAPFFRVATAQAARARVIAALVALAAAAMLALAGPASAAYIHPSESWGFGQDGTSSSEFTNESQGGPSGEIERIYIDQASHTLSAIWEPGCCFAKRLSVFEIGGPESMTPLGGNFPLPIEGFSFTGLAMDESNTPSAGRIYIKTFGEEGPRVLTADGAPVFGVNFEPQPGFKSGVAVDLEGNIYMANRDTNKIEVFESAGGPPFRLIPLPKEGNGEPQRLAFDKLNGDLFVAIGSSIFRLTEEDNYEDPAPLRYETGAQDEMAIDAGAGIIYTTLFPEYPPVFSQGWRAYEIETGATLETHVAATGTENQARSIAVDESTHTVYTANDDATIEQAEEWRPGGRGRRDDRRIDRQRDRARNG